jgi:ABC-type phosphate transport system substrate-binding protein
MPPLGQIRYGKMENMKMYCRAAIGMIAGIALIATSAAAANLTGAGSTFVYPIISKWAGAYRDISGNRINYQSIGSGGGIAQIKARTVTFGATDKPLTTKELNAAGLTQFPIVIGSVVPVINVPGIKPGQMVLDGTTLAKQVKEKYPQIKIIFISGYAEDKFKEHLGADVWFLPKPFTLKQLATKVKEVIDSSN